MPRGVAAKFKVPIKKSKLNDYVKDRLGYYRRPGATIFELCCQALAKDGFPMPPGVTAKGWVIRNLHVVHAIHERIVQIKSNQWVREVTKPNNPTDPKADEFLYSFAWRKTRMQALKKYGTKCMCCGASPKTGAVINVDHIKPRKFFPDLALDLNNLQILCQECNHGKGNWDKTDWRPI